MSEAIEQTADQLHSSPVTLSTSSLGALRSWLQSQRTQSRGRGTLQKKDIRRAMRLVCDDVRTRQIPVERLIILLKEQWYSLAEAGDGASERTRDALDEIIRTCIEEYYSAVSPPSRADGDGHAFAAPS